MATVYDNFWKLTGSSKDTADAFAGNDAPKLKFNYTVKFVPRGYALDHPGAIEMAAMDYGVKTTTRPKPNIEYQDANFYNFRTKIAVRADYGTGTIVFYDDANNRAHTVLTAYFKAVSPIFSANAGQATSFEENGMSTAASIGPLTNKSGALDSIIVTHYYTKGNSVGKTTYTYINPKFTSIDMDDLDMSSSEPSLVTVNFNYETVSIT